MNTTLVLNRLVALLLLVGARANAQSSGTSELPTEAHKARPDGAPSGSTDLTLEEPATANGHVSFTPYFWLTSYSGSIEAQGIQVDLDKSVIDILNGTDFLLGAMGALDLDYKGFVFQLNAAWGTVEGSEEKAAFADVSMDANVDVDGAFMELFGGYRFVDTPLSGAPDAVNRFKLDAYGGGRVTSIKVDMDLYASTSVTLPNGEVLTAGQSTEVDQSGDWFEPFVGLRGIFDLDEHWLFQIRGDVGGFGVDGSEFAWQAAAALGYRWHHEGWDFAVVGGYRALGQDYTSGDFHWDVVTHGPLIGVSFSWAF